MRRSREISSPTAFSTSFPPRSCTIIYRICYKSFVANLELADVLCSFTICYRNDSVHRRCRSGIGDILSPLLPRTRSTASLPEMNSNADAVIVTRRSRGRLVAGARRSSPSIRAPCGALMLQNICKAFEQGKVGLKKNNNDNSQIWKNDDLDKCGF